MRIKVIILTVLAIVAMLVPTASAFADNPPFWSGTATGVSVVDACAVYSNADCATSHQITSGQSFPITTVYKVGDTYTLNVWVKNSSTTIDYTVTPSIICSTTGAITFSGVNPQAVSKNGGIAAFTFVATAVQVGGPYNVQLTFAHN